MHPMFAEDLSGWLFAGTVLFGGLLAAVMALGALIPASKANKGATWMLAAPALVVGLAVSAWFVYGYLTEGLHDADSSLGQDFVLPWIFMGGPALGSGLLALAVLWFKTRRGYES